MNSAPATASAGSPPFVTRHGSVTVWSESLSVIVVPLICHRAAPGATVTVSTVVSVAVVVVDVVSVGVVSVLVSVGVVSVSVSVGVVSVSVSVGVVSVSVSVGVVEVSVVVVVTALISITPPLTVTLSEISFPSVS